MTVSGDLGAGGGPRSGLGADLHADAVARETRRLAALLERGDLSTPVPACPGWTLLDLVRHTGGVQRWFSALLRAGVQEAPRTREVQLDLPEREDAYGAWLVAGAELAARAFAEVDTGAPMWTWGADPHARFWVRRMLYETLVHRTDAEAALGLPTVIDPVLAADGVDEFLVNLPYATPFAPGVVRLRGRDEVLRFRADDTGQEWLVQLRSDGFGLIRATGQDADASVRGAAADLLLLLYGRLGRNAEAFRTAGDPELLDRWFDNSAF